MITRGQAKRSQHHPPDPQTHIVIRVGGTIVPPEVPTHTRSWSPHVGAMVLRHFPGYGDFTGTVTAYQPPYWTVKYEDGDTEDMTDEEVREHRRLSLRSLHAAGPVAVTIAFEGRRIRCAQDLGSEQWLYGAKNVRRGNPITGEDQ